MPDDIVGGSLDRLRRQIPVLARETFPLVLVGERGTGKSLLAAHINACTSSDPLPWLNVALLSERERRLGLFGAEPPELSTTKRSVLEYPAVVLLKHIDAAEPYLQAKLAESLHECRFTRMGSRRPLPVAARIIFTLRQPAHVLALSGRLNARLARMLHACRTVRLAPLRARRGDIQDLALHFLNAFGSDRPPLTDAGGKLDPALAGVLLRQPYPDNVRDLIALVRGLAVRDVCRQDAEREVMKMVAMIERGGEFSLPDALCIIERSIVQAASGACGGRPTEIARRLGITERDVRRKLGRRLV